jgi:catechol 2,3-dioxygenase-like lactoylglutathione lyase family enzyme
MNVRRLDHLVLTVADPQVTRRFYEQVLGMDSQVMPNGRIALHFGNQKINLHQVGSAVEPRAAVATPGSADLCFVTDTPVAEVIEGLEALSVPIVEGPVERAGALGRMQSVYLRDPDGNLVEVSRYEEGGR